mmetsp:Transcript_19026/g.22724  ORF Transcript_19026/g.22724 Transcript_19026/m.22724 type:complete len:261 (+) Transcript_19026:548-1330(+)|eukprot:CAMPEP_0198251204 /NCGR_PEP_ID=MMETSP1447-20131203/2114_1 /TAXON_ID=420782 /ORGANISM="Chaetoceros dichaeta, Strain CCMP1751" /LENGTH=260 /DNA_ID=CAMNT_0043936167 /DNA_START=43 /DNA_END=825 /DNA_ORIENTATION=-
MPQPSITPHHIRLLKSHRAIAINQLSSIQSIISEIDSLLAPHSDPNVFRLNDKVISTTAPSKNRVGLVTKVTSSFIYVQPLDNKFSPYKKAHKNLAHHSTIQDADSFVPTTATQLVIRRPPTRNTSSSASPKTTTRHLTKTTSPPLQELDTIDVARSSTTTSNLAPPPRTLPTSSLHSSQTPSSSLLRILSPSSPIPSPTTERRLRRQFHIDRGLQRPFTPPPAPRARKQAKPSAQSRSTSASTARCARDDTRPGKRAKR